MLAVCLLVWQLAGCGSDVDPVAVSEAAEIGVSQYTQETVVAAAKLPSSGDDASQAASAPKSPATAVSTLDSTDSRVVWWIDPRKRFADLEKSQAVTQVHGPNQHLEKVPEGGIIGSGADYALSRGLDPLDSSKSAFRHRLSSSFPTWGSAGASRSEISANYSNDGTNVTRGIEYWVAFAFKFDPDMFGQGNGGAGLFEFHQVPDPGENWLPSSLGMIAGEDNLQFVVRTDSSQPTPDKAPPASTLWRETSPSTTEWHRFIVKVRLHWDAGKSPYLKIWRAVGDGPLLQIVNHNGPNDYRNNAPYVPQKFGLYRWDSWAGKSTRTLYTKGLYILKAEAGSPAIDEQTLLELLRQI